MSESETKPARVLIIDDSALVRELLTGIISSDPRLTVVGTAPDPIIARDKIKALSPDVLTLDVEMPRMNGIEFLEKIMRLRPMPVVMISTLTREGADTTLRALELGAFDYVAKPTQRLTEAIEPLKREICDKVAAAAKARVRGLSPSPKPAHAVPVADASDPARYAGVDVIGLGASTGGVEALGEVLSAIPPDAPAIAIVQHLPGAYTARFAARLDGQLRLKVVEAEDGMPMQPGHVYIGRGEKRFEVAKGAGGKPVCRVVDGEKESGHLPSIDRLFASLVAFGPRACAALLTGMGRDGVNGLKQMRAAGAVTIAQDQATSVVYGMPRAAMEEGAASRQLALTRIAAALLEAASAKTGDGK
ncbi:MAG: chemotaxis response regulator protein-glutamate methylesterase [Proteobacteria bacterium]|nr:chemotaxis response regulator protein-glutamate methylesterase [Pseudomonadota bacterium]